MCATEFSQECLLPNLKTEKLVLKLIHEEGLGKVGGSMSHRDQRESLGLVSSSEIKGVRENPIVPNS